MAKEAGSSFQRQRQKEQRQESSSMDLVQCGAIVAFVALALQLLFLALSSNSPRNEQTTTPSPREPILLMGLPRSGSSALHEYFTTCHGKSSAHYCCGEKDGSTQFPCNKPEKMCGSCVLKNLQAHQPAFEQCSSSSSSETPMIQIWSRFDVETSDAWFLPQHFALGLLHESYPNATWILNTRGSAQQWAESVLHWHSMTRRLFVTYNLDLYPHPIPTPPDLKAKITPEELEVEMVKALDERVYNRTEHLRKRTLLERIYQNHTQTIRWWAKQFPSHQLIEINVDEEDASLKALALFFGKQQGQEEKHCPWTFEPPNDDWKDFSLPFETSQ